MRAPSRHLVPLAAATPWALWALLRGTGTERGFPLVPAMTFTPYAAGTSVLPLALAVARRSAPAGVLAALAGATLTGAVLGRRGARSTPVVPGGRRLRLGTVNLRLGRADPAGVLALVRDHDLDVLALQEVTPQAEEGLRAAGIDGLLPYSHVIAARAGNPPGAGGAVWSRLPVLERGAVPGRFEQPCVRLAVPGAPEVAVTAVHSQPPASSPGDVTRWRQDLRALPDPAAPGPLQVLAGDFNATLDHAQLRAVLARGYVDAARAAGSALVSTWSPERVGHPRLAIDHVLVDRAIGVVTVATRRIRGSDHRAVIALLALPLPAP